MDAVLAAPSADSIGAKATPITRTTSKKSENLFPLPHAQFLQVGEHMFGTLEHRLQVAELPVGQASLDPGEEETQVDVAEPCF